MGSFLTKTSKDCVGLWFLAQAGEYWRSRGLRSVLSRGLVVLGHGASARLLLALTGTVADVVPCMMRPAGRKCEKLI